MKLSIKKIFIIIAGFILIVSTGIFVYKRYIRIQNVFDQMFYTRIRTHYDWWEGSMGGFGNKITSFNKMPQIKPYTRDSEAFFTEYGTFTDYYKDEYLNDGESLSVNCSCNPNVLTITAAKHLNGIEIVYIYTYDVQAKRLQESVEYSGEEVAKDMQEVLALSKASGVTQEDWVKYKQYFLYEKLLTDWLAVNSSRFSIDHWGNVEFIQVLPSVSISH